MRALGRGLWAFAALVVFYFLAALAGALIPGSMTEGTKDDPAHRIFLIPGPIHYDFLIPLTPGTRAAFSDLVPHGIAVNDPQVRWMIIGWGAREFYTTTGGYTDLSLTTIWRSFTGDASVLRVDTVGPLRDDLDLRGIDVSEAQFTRFRSAIKQSFRLDADGSVLPVPGAGFGETDRFFEANGRFDALRTCNTWVSRMIRAAGLRFGIWTPTPYAVTVSLKHFHAP